MIDLFQCLTVLSFIGVYAYVNSAPQIERAREIPHGDDDGC